ncbi:MAG: CAP domain-containing protein [Bacteroidales bacterium]|nr:CAP domain-containing protein [Bacteroidales bacterium]MBQ5577063.1 CAP domain-containing protein [Bacteroidales bacterium]
MKKILTIVALLLAMQGLHAQSFSEWSNQELAKANTAQNTNLTQQEKLVFLYCNLARMDGAKFMRTYAAKYLTGSSSYVASLKRDLQQVKNRPMLYPEKDLCYTAAIHAEDMGTHGMIGHNSSDGTACFTRIRKYYKCGTAAENCSYGYSDALDIVMQLLIDENTSSLGHRKSILNGAYNAMGTSIKKHKVYGYNCVQDFGAELLTPLSGSSSSNSNNYNDNRQNNYNDNKQNNNRSNNNSSTNRNNGPSVPSSGGSKSSNEVENAFVYLNAVRKNPARYSQEIGVNLSGVKAMPELKWNHTLAKVAQEKAQDMATRDYFGHVDPDGSGINFKINAAGYKLQANWLEDFSSNYFESISAGIPDGKSTIIQLINDDGEDNENAGHRRHLLGIDSFWSNCYDIGIGMAKGGSYGYYWCIIIAKHSF